MTPPGDVLRQLAEAYGVETGYHDDRGTWHDAEPESILAVARILGAEVESVADAASALRQRRHLLWSRPIEPVLVAWDGTAQDVCLRLPAREASATIGCRLELESGETRFWSTKASELPVVETADVEGVVHAVYHLALLSALPLGYHSLILQLPGRTCKSLVLSAPTRAYSPEKEQKSWGAFLPLYALRTGKDWGVGNLTDLGNLIEWVQHRGGAFVGTLPLGAAFLDEPFEPSPYSPASRLFWNELYIDPLQSPELLRAPAARALLNSPAFQQELAELRKKPRVDYRGAAAVKRRVLSELSRAFFAEPAGRMEAFQRFIDAYPRAEEYARFRAAGEKLRTSWWNWPERMREARPGALLQADFDDEAKRYHLYVQWLADEQLRALAKKARENGPGLYLDLPLGVNSDGYDVWRERDSFALGASAGAPPDSFFTGGQDWGFPPLHPENVRAGGYKYLRDCLSRQFQFAGMLRIDHMMGLHRFYWVPRGFEAGRGAYVRYPAEELYAVHCLESHRGKAVLVGEDLGTVPPTVRPAMEKHHIHRLFVSQYELKPWQDAAVTPPYPGSVAGLNTHDMPTFAGFWRGLDIEDRVQMGLMDEKAARWEAEQRAKVREAVVQTLRQAGRLGDDDDEPSVLRACLEQLAAGEPLAVMVNMEDLWQETEPQNRPGTTWDKMPNWQVRAAHPVEDFDSLPGLRDTLEALNRVIHDGQDGAR